MFKLELEDWRKGEAAVWDEMDEELLQVLTKSGRLVDGECLKHSSDSPCKKRKVLVVC